MEGESSRKPVRSIDSHPSRRPVAENGVPDCLLFTGHGQDVLVVRDVMIEAKRDGALLVVQGRDAAQGGGRPRLARSARDAHQLNRKQFSAHAVCQGRERKIDCVVDLLNNAGHSDATAARDSQRAVRLTPPLPLTM